METKTLQKRLKDAELQVATMKQQLHKYVQEVKRAEDLLLKKVNDKMHGFHMELSCNLARCTLSLRKRSARSCWITITV